MNIFGSVKELVKIVWRKSSRQVTLEPSAQTVGDSVINIPDMAGTTQNVVLTSQSQALTNKTIDADLNTITNIENADIKAGAAIDATKIADGSVTSAEFQRINSLTSNAQDQIDTKMVGAASSTDNAIARFDLTTGKLLQNSTVTLGDTGILAGATLDGDDNTVQDLPITALKTNITDASKFLVRDASGVPTSATKAVPAGDVVGTSDAQVLTGKDFDGGTASNTSRLTVPKASKATLDALTRKEATLAYASDLNKLYADDGSTLVEVGSGTSAVNLIPNSDFENGTASDWTATDADIAITASATTPLRGSYSGSIAATSGVDIGDYVGVPFTLPNEYKSRAMRASFYFEAGTGYDAADAQLIIRDITNSTDITPSTTDIPGGSGRFDVSWNATTSTSYALRIVSKVAGSAWTLKVDDFQVNDNQLVQGAAIGDFSLNTGFSFDGLGTVSNQAVYSQRIGDKMVVRGTVQTGTVSASDAAINLPTGFVLDSTKITSNVNVAMVGIWKGHASAQTDLTASNVVDGPIFYDGSTTGKLYFAFRTGNTSNRFTKANNNFNSNQTLSFQFEIPISTWTSNTTLATSRVEYAYNTATADSADTSSFAYGPAGNALPTALTVARKKRVRFQSAIQPTDSIVIEIDNTGNGQWTVLGQGADSNGLGIWPHIFQNANDYGIGWAYVNSTDIDVMFGHYAYNNGATFGAAGADWNNGNITSYKWRVRKSSGIGAGEVAPATTTSSGYVVGLPNGQVRLDTTNGHGATSTKVRRWTTTIENTGTAITYADDANLGGTFTINQNGIYGITCNDNFSGASEQLAITLNSAALTTNASSQASGVNLAFVNGSGGDSNISVSWTGKLVAGDVIRIMTAAGATGSLPAAGRNVTVAQLFRTA